MSNFTLQVTVQVDVQNAENIQQARETVFALLSAPKESKSRKGRPASGPKATVTGVQIPSPMAVRSFDLDPQVEVTEITP